MDPVPHCITLLPVRRNHNKSLQIVKLRFAWMEVGLAVALVRVCMSWRVQATPVLEHHLVPDTNPRAS